MAEWVETSGKGPVKERKLSDLSRALSAPCLTVEQLLSSDRDAALDQLLDLVASDPDCQSVLPNWSASRETVAELYWFLARASAGQCVKGLLAPCIAVANPWTLEYMLACRDRNLLNVNAAMTVLMFFQTGGKSLDLLRKPHAIDVAITIGPAKRPTGIYRPYSITAMHRREADEWERRQRRSFRMRRWLIWTAVGLGLLCGIPLVAGAADWRNVLRGIGSLMMVIGAILTHTVKWGDCGPGSMNRPLTIAGLFVFGFVLIKFV